MPAGNVRFDVYNQGPATHEFVVVRTNLRASRLPIASDGLTVNEEALDAVGQISQIDIWSTETLDLDLTPGRYVFFCNVEGHYMGGMRGSIVVTGDG
ncbi:MAG: sulfocyanin-like copper-binding protein [Actinomycetota bacterium]